jgi:acetyl esterase/lipase
MSRKIITTILFAHTLLFATHCNIPTLLLAPAPTSTATPPVAFATTPEPTDTRTPRPTPTPLDVPSKVERDVTYCTIDNVALKLDLYFPSQTTGKPLPVAINLHGGSWSAGDKQNSDSAVDIPVLVERGYLVVGVNYRLAPTYKFPAQIEDVKCAVRFLRANAAKYSLDANRIGAWGCSAGGHLVSLLGVTDKSASWDNVGEYKDQSSRIQAAVPLCAPSDLTLYDIITRADMLKRVFGSDTGVNPSLLRGSPITFVTKDDPPFLIFQGDKDIVISLKHGAELYGKLIAAGASAKLVTVKNGTHCLPPELGMSPTREEISQMIADFFDQTLRK